MIYAEILNQYINSKSDLTKHYALVDKEKQEEPKQITRVGVNNQPCRIIVIVDGKSQEFQSMASVYRKYNVSTNYVKKYAESGEVYTNKFGVKMRFEYAK